MEVTTKTIAIPEKGLDADFIKAQLKAMKSHDVPWQSGKVLAYVYEPSAETYALTKEAYGMYLSENGLDPTAFPSLLKMENDIIGMAANLLGGDEQTVGSFTSGGTESIMLAVKTARDYYRENHPEVTEPELIVGETAHAAFHKAGHYLGVNVISVPVDEQSFKINVKAMEAAITPNTIMLVGSSPSYAHGVIDPIEEIAVLARERQLFLHVDACVGGFYLPFLKKVGYDVPAFDFSVEGVTSMSCDFHKYGYAAKGASCVLYKNRDLRRHQIYACSSWSGYAIVNSTVLSSKTGGPLAGAWATLHHIGQEGYMNIVKASQEATQLFLAGIQEIPELEVMGTPNANLVAVASVDERINVFEISDWMGAKGWHIQVQFAVSCSKEALHLSINRANIAFIPELLEDLKTAIKVLKAKDQPAMDFDPAMLAPLLDNMNAEAFDNLAQMMGLGGNEKGLPDEMAMINNIINKLTSTQRNALLAEFMNKLYTNS